MKKIKRTGKVRKNQNHDDSMTKIIVNTEDPSSKHADSMDSLSPSQPLLLLNHIQCQHRADEYKFFAG